MLNDLRPNDSAGYRWFPPQFGGVRRFIAPWLVVCSMTLGCTFNGGGVGARDGALGAEDSRVDVRSDTGLAIDTGVSDGGDAECASAIGGPVCRFVGDEDTIGQSGVCSNGRFTLTRHCFAEAPCQPGVGACIPNGCTACPLTGQTCAGGVCTAFSSFVAGRPQQCCVTFGANGSAVFPDTCEQGADCATGICLASGICFQPCLTAADCADGRSCGAVFVELGQATLSLYACAATSPDAGVAVDAGLDLDATADVETVVDAGIPAPSDAMINEASAADAITE